MLVPRSRPGGEVVLAGFYDEPLSFAFPPAFMREARIRVAAEWREPDLAAVVGAHRQRPLVPGRAHHPQSRAADAEAAYRTAFDDPSCLKMVLDWRDCA